MASSTTMTIRLDPEVKDKLGRLAAETRRSRSYLAAEAVAAYVDRELEIIAGVQRGLDDMKAGRLAPNDEVMDEARAAIDEAKRARRR